MKQKNRSRGITLIALVITIIVLLILAGISIATLTGENGVLTKASKAKEEELKSQATEILKIKMTDCQMESMGEKGQYPTLAYLAAFLENDGEIAYVKKQSRQLATLDETPYTDWDKIYTKLEEYPYEFEINGSFQVAVNGEPVSIPTGYMKIPTETKNITENGEEIDVLNYAKVNVNVPLPEGFVKPIGTKDITTNGEYDILNYAKVNVNVPETTGKGKYWDNGYFNIAAHNTYTINLGFNPSYICFTNRTNGSSVMYNTNLSTDKQYINGAEYPLNRDGTTIISVGSAVVFRSNYDLIWDWVALP